ncbi:MAG: hypothetical protein J6R96_04910 [Spirochaetaceae bacterium]|nr:hypothetical protein [Spirochaetaceae bacterium]
MKKIFFLILTLSFSLEIFANQPKPTPLPTFPEMKEAILLQKQMMEDQKKIHPIVWSLNWHTGIQNIVVKQLDSVNNVYMDMSEIIFTSNKYKGAVLSIDVASLFSIYSNLSIGFTQGNFPKDFSVNTIPYQSAHLSSIESDSYVAKKFYLKNNFSVAPYAGYTFSRYRLIPIQEGIDITNKIYHSVVVGNKFIFQPHRNFFIETSISLSPLTSIDRNLLSMFQINYESYFTFTTDIFTFALVISSRNNIEYKNVHQEASTLTVSKTGFRFRLSL